MQIYLVGGAVRDSLIGRAIKDRDFVVVGATPTQMLALGYQQVGRDFPVFLHPDSKEEYALARRERKMGMGHKNFAFDINTVSLQDDLSRRDITINAMAMDDTGAIIDPFGGQQDLQKRILRHVSQAFCEDPLRVFRVARFAATLDFSVHDDTMTLMRTMTNELGDLSAERVAQETLRALDTPHPWRYFEVLRDAGALGYWFGELDALFGIPQPAVHHPEIDAGVHTMLALAQGVRLGADIATRWAIVCHDLGKALTPKHLLPRHIGHEMRGVAPTITLCNRLKLPHKMRDFAIKVTQEHGKCHILAQMRAPAIYRMLKTFGLNPVQVDKFACACMADSRGRLGFEERDYPQADILRTLSHDLAMHKISVPNQLAGKQIGEYIERQRIAFIKNWLAAHPMPA